MAAMRMISRIRGSAPWLVVVAVVLSVEESALADDTKDELPDHTIIVGVGGAAEFESGDRSLHPGANIMVEWDAIEDWLELEVGASVLPAPSGTTVPMDLLVKKPFRITRGFEPVSKEGHYIFETLELVRWPAWRVRAGLGEGLTSGSNPLTVTTILGHFF